MTTRIGWAVEPVVATIKQGSGGAFRLTMTVTQSDGVTPLPSYDGWTCVVALCRTVQGDPEITLEPAVTGASPQFLVDVIFSTDDTKDKAPGELKGDVCMIEPVTGKRYYPADITLTIERSYTPVTA
jgi:hypothetical protein